MFILLFNVIKNYLVKLIFVFILVSQINFKRNILKSYVTNINLSYNFLSITFSMHILQ